MREIADLARSLPVTVRNRFDMLLAASPAPELGLQNFVRLRERQPAAFERLTRSTAGLRHLVAVFANSRFLAEEILEHPDWAEHLLDASELTSVIAADALRSQLEAVLPPGLPDPLELAKFRRRQILRIVVRDVLGLGTLPEITAELSDLADTLVEVAYERIYADLVTRYGVPRAEADTREAYFAVIALGKLGGKELNYSSDIDLMFLYSEAGSTDGAERITNKEFFMRAANQLTDLLSTYTAEGMCYRVDLRLRPDGSLGEVCISLDAARKYYAERARDWELQMLIKARVAAGHPSTGRALLNFVEPLTYSTTLDFSAVEQLSLTRERLNEKLAERQAKWGLATRIRDARLHRREAGARRHPGYRIPGAVSPAPLWRRRSVGASWRHDAGAWRGCKTRIFFPEPNTGGWPRPTSFCGTWNTGCNSRTICRRIRCPPTRTRWSCWPGACPAEEPRPGSCASCAGISPAWRKSTRAWCALKLLRPKRHCLMTALTPTWRARATWCWHWISTPRRWRRPWAARICKRAIAPSSISSNAFRATRSAWTFSTPTATWPSTRWTCSSTAPTSPSSSSVRRSWWMRSRAPASLWRWRVPCRVSCRSCGAGSAARWCGFRPKACAAPIAIFDTLARTSELADAVIERAYQIAVAETQRTHPPQNAAYDPLNQMWVIALGRLGMREFDLASDADLVFVLADSDAAELQFWTRVAGHLVDIVAAYTGDGVLFTVDTRLRPNGGGGPLVQTESAVKEYFERSAEAWEGITYMKSRTVAGDPARAEAFLHQLQEADWRRYGQGGRSRTELRQMRVRLEKEQGPLHPLKAGRGGYYDIDFLLMYLRLKSAGVFFRVLNTPARIEVLESMGDMDRAEAQFLLDAATFYRALDHALRVLSGHAEGKLPKSEVHRDTIAALLRRWTPIRLTELGEIRNKVRAAFDRQFG